ncbi:MAG: tetratricopeptide repeat protein [Sulfuricellaceae bacterium]
MTAPQTLSIDVALQQAVVHHQAGRLHEAEQLYRAILQVLPGQPDANHNLGVLAGQVGQHAAGLPYLKTALEINPAQGQYALSYAEALLATGQAGEARDILHAALLHGFNTPTAQALWQKADAAAGDAPTFAEVDQLVALFNAGRYEELESRARLLLERHPNIGFVWKVLGVSLKMQGKESLPALQKATEFSPGDAEAHCNLGIAQQDIGQLDAAAGSYARAVEIKPDFAEAHYNLGIALQSLGQLDGAVASYVQALEIEPDFAEAHNSLGATLRDLGRLEDARASCAQALKIKPDYAEAHDNLGRVLNNLGQPDGAEASFLRALEIKPDFAEAHNDLGIALRELGRLDDAQASCRRALEIKPDFAEAYNNLGIALRELGQLEEAAASYRRALEIKPDYADARFNLGLCLLTMGRHFEGWREYEYRWEAGQPKPSYPATSLPQWAGQNLSPANRLLVFEEQGMGDRLQFARYLPLAAEHFAGGVSFVSDSALLALFRRSFPGVEILEVAPADQSAWQWQCPLLSLPRAFGAALDAIPKQTPYLIPDPARAACWQARIADLGLPAATRKIGVAWKKGRLMKNAPLYSLTLQQLAPLLDLPGCAWFSLQKEPDPDKAPWVASGKLIDWAEELGDFDETAALAINLDLIVSVDTAVVHLAGGLGRPTWLLNRYASDWRWMRDREDSPWYSTMRIFTQKNAGDWDEVVRRMADVLTDMPAPPLHS